MRHARPLLRLLLLLPVLLLKSCEVPDVQPFAQATADMATTLDASLRQLTDDFARLDAADLTPPQHTQLRQDQDSLRRIVRGFEPVMRALVGYANALSEVTEAHAARAATAKKINQAVNDLATATLALGPLPAVAKVVAKPAALLAADLNDLRALHGLRRLASPRQDSLIQHTAVVLRLCLGEFGRIDRRLNTALAASLPVSDLSTQHYYAASRQLQALLAGQLQLLTAAQVAALGGQPQELARLPFTVAEVLKFEQLADPDTLVQHGWWLARHRRPVGYAPLLKAIAQRRALYQQQSELPQAQYDAAVARLPSQATAAAVLGKSQQALAVWAASHHDLRLALLQDSRVTRQDLIDHARAIQQLLDDLHALEK